MKLRPHVERIIAAVTRYNGARRAEAFGLDNADFQLKMCAMAYNRSAELTTKPQTLAHLNQRKGKSPTLQTARPRGLSDPPARFYAIFSLSDATGGLPLPAD